MTADPTRYVIYARQSLGNPRDGDDSASIETQVRACKEHIQRVGGTVVGVYEDPDTRGWRTDRPAFLQMLQRFRDGTADVCVVFKLSRFARNLMHQETVLTEIAEAGGELVSVSEPYLNTSPMVRQILGAVNEQYKRDQGDFMRAAWASRARRGYHHGGAPFGYRMVDGTLEVDEPAASAVRDMYDWAEQGHGAPEIAYRLNAAGVDPPRGGTQWHDERVLRLLRRPVYCGRIVLNGEVVCERGVHEPLVDPDRFDAIQAILDRRKRVRRKASPSWLDGFVYHACGVRMYAAKWRPDTETEPRWRFRCGHANPSKTSRFRRCPLSPKTIFADTAEVAMVQLLAETIPTLRTPAEVIEAMEASRAEGSRDRERRRARLQRRVDDLARQRDRLLDLTLQGTVDEDVYAERDGKLKAELQAIRDELAAVPAPVKAADVERQREAYQEVGLSILTVAHLAPQELPPLLHQLDARLVVGNGEPRLVFGPASAAYFGS